MDVCERPFLEWLIHWGHATRVVKLCDLSEKSILQHIDRVDGVGDYYDELSKEDDKKQFGTLRDTSMVLSIRKWEFHAFKASQR